MSKQEKDELRGKLKLYLILNKVSYIDFINHNTSQEWLSKTCSRCDLEKICACGVKTLYITKNGELVVTPEVSSSSNNLSRCVEWIKYV